MPPTSAGLRIHGCGAGGGCAVPPGTGTPGTGTRGGAGATSGGADAVQPERWVRRMGRRARRWRS